MQNFLTLASSWSWAGRFESYLVANPEDRFSSDEAQIWTGAGQTQQNDLCAQWRLRSAWASPQSDQSLLSALWVAKDQNLLQADSEDSDQPGHPPRLIWVFAGRTDHFVGFVVLWLYMLCKNEWGPVLYDCDKSLRCLLHKNMNVVNGNTKYHNPFLTWFVWIQHGCLGSFFNINLKLKMSQLMRLWHFSSSVNSFFKHTCAAIQWG